jgi:hypothetical protein
MKRRDFREQLSDYQLVTDLIQGVGSKLMQEDKTLCANCKWQPILPESSLPLHPDMFHINAIFYYRQQNLL